MFIPNKSPGFVARVQLSGNSRPTYEGFGSTDPVVERFESWARNHLSKGFSLDAAASVVGASKRTLARRMQTVLGKSPLAFFQDLRIERAVHSLRTTDNSVDEIAKLVGYSDAVTLRMLLRKRLGRSSSQIRKDT